MRTLIAGVALALLTIAPLANAADKKKSAKPEALFINASDIVWGDAPPVLPKGAQIAVLYGNPFKKGPYAMRLKMPDGYKIPPHWHTLDEQLTILSGVFMLHMGDTMDAPAHSLEADGYHFLPAKMHHAAEVKGEVILQINGVGPFDIHYLNPADDPTKAAAAK